MQEIFTLFNSNLKMSSSKIISTLENLSLDECFESEKFLSYLDDYSESPSPHLVSRLMGFVQSYQFLPLSNSQIDEFLLN